MWPLGFMLECRCLEDHIKTLLNRQAQEGLIFLVAPVEAPQLLTEEMTQEMQADIQLPARAELIVLPTSPLLSILEIQAEIESP